MEKVCLSNVHHAPTAVCSSLYAAARRVVFKSPTVATQHITEMRRTAQQKEFRRRNGALDVHHAHEFETLTTGLMYYVVCTAVLVFVGPINTPADSVRFFAGIDTERATRLMQI